MDTPANEPTVAPPATHAPPASLKAGVLLALAALGVVYGDLGTSVLYAIRECFKPMPNSLDPTPENIISVLSLVCWLLTLVVVFKYLVMVMRAQNHGEGGILALLALLLSHEEQESAGRRFSRRAIWTILGLFATALLLSDGMITPAISVISAIEGLEVATPSLADLVVPLSVFILIGLFAVQRFGTAKIAKYFGPIMLGWFTMIALLGIPWIVEHPEILAAVDPRQGFGLFVRSPLQGFFLLGALVLCITGAEALYADMGHFGRRPIQVAWYFAVYPALLLNYLGQGAFLISRQGAIMEIDPQGNYEVINIFFLMAPEIMLYPVLLMATLATIIASQALISGAYSLAEQAVQLGFSPRLTIIHTSADVKGQIYVPFVNWTLMCACVLLVIIFKASANLAAAYGIAVVGTMVITSLLYFEVMRVRWSWPSLVACFVLILFLVVDVPLLVANLTKLGTGGWVPVLMATFIFTLMITWRHGKAILNDPSNTESFRFPLKLFVREIAETKPRRSSETAVMLTAIEDMVPMALLQSVERTQTLPHRLVMLTVRSLPVPHVSDADAIEIRKYEEGCYGVTARHGFMEEPNIPRYLEICTRRGLELDPDHVWFFLSRMTIMTTGKTPIAPWRKQLFAFMYHHARPETASFKIPPNRVIELGRLIEL
ncbi:MAG: KUP/HAK/KT family potassium transporter [Planctomycetia bacterium]|nr:KUP/HAK/KT family potassium transporter [Planctomycetia bacterium]